MAYSVDKFILIYPYFIHQQQMSVFETHKAVSYKTHNSLPALSGKPDNLS